MATLTPDTKQVLSATVRALRERLIRAIGDEAERKYHLSLPVEHTGLEAADRNKRLQLEAWLGERFGGICSARGEAEPSSQARQRHLLLQAAKEVGASLLNCLVLVRHVQALGLWAPPVVMVGRGNTDRESCCFGCALRSDESKCFGQLLQGHSDEALVELPPAFRDTEANGLLPVPPEVVQEAESRLDDPRLRPAWADDSTLGWVYQFWNDPERELIDSALDAQSKLRDVDIAAKTQVFTERYMVEWLLQNSLGFAWLCICQRNGWQPDAAKLIPRIEARRSAWQSEREAGRNPDWASVQGRDEGEARWKYYLPRPISESAIAEAPQSIRDLKILDPACGCGHFLLVAFDLLVPMYREEARHRGWSFTDQQIAESILERNLHGLDLDSRATQIASVALQLKAMGLSKAARPKRLNLGAPVPQLRNTGDAAQIRERLSDAFEMTTGASHAVATRLAEASTKIGQLGTLYRLDDCWEDAMGAGSPAKGRGGTKSPDDSLASSADVRKGIEAILDAETDCGRSRELIGQDECTSALQFLRIAQEGTYALVVGNPPYFGTQALENPAYIDTHYPQSKENLCTAFLDRAMELARPGGQVAFVSVRNWLYVSQLSEFRDRLFRRFPPVVAADLGLGGFASLPGVEVVMLVVAHGAQGKCLVLNAESGGMVEKASSLLAAGPVWRTDPSLLAQLPGSPFVYRWQSAAIREYLDCQQLGEIAPVRVGMKTSDNLRFLRKPWELPAETVQKAIASVGIGKDWVPYVKGAAGKAWLEPLADLVLWADGGLQVRIALEAAYGQGPQGERFFLRRGVAFSTIGRSFLARAHRYPSIFDVAGSSVFPPDVAATVCLLNSRFAKQIVEDLNPTINFQVGDVARIPYRPDPLAGQVFRTLEEAFEHDEEGQEQSPRFRKPGPSHWQYAQDWAQEAVDRGPGDPLPSYRLVEAQPPPTSVVSFAVGVALGRFGAHGEGILDKAGSTALPSGLLYVSIAGKDCLDHPGCSLLWDAWRKHGQQVGRGQDLRTYLRRSFFDDHRKLYENRPVYFPLSSARRGFVAFANIHQWNQATLKVLLTDYLVPERCGLLGQLEQHRLRHAGAGGGEIRKLLKELEDFIDSVRMVEEKGPPPPDEKTTPREVDSQFEMDLEDGVLVNSAALWPLLDPQWKDPKRWWTQLARREGPKGTHFDWSRVAAKYFPTRVREECARNPVMASAHRCLWRYHPRIAYAWELRQQLLLGVDYRMNEPEANSIRQHFLTESRSDAAQVYSREISRRKRSTMPPQQSTGFAEGQ